MDKPRNFTKAIIAFSIILVGIVALLFFLPEYEGVIAFDVTILPLLNAIFNSFTFTFLLLALYAIKKKDIPLHRSFIMAAFTTTALFLISYVAYHFLTESTKFGGSSSVKYIYFFILITHVLLAIVNVPLALITITRGFNNQVKQHKKIARWTMPIWLYVSFTGVVVYLMISPYY